MATGSDSVRAVCQGFVSRVPGVEHVILTTPYGLPVTRVSAESAKTDASAIESQFSMVFFKSAEAADKLAFGTSKTNTAFYDDFILVQSSMPPLILTVVAAADANVGMIHLLLPQLQKALEPVRLKAEEESPE